MITRKIYGFLKLGILAYVTLVLKVNRVNIALFTIKIDKKTCFEVNLIDKRALTRACKFNLN